jgi:multiple sugar transport system ATP-binding protein
MYDKPANLFVAGFMGSPSMNLMELPVVDGGVRFGDLVVPVARDTLADAHAPSVTLGIRPENLVVSDSGLKLEVDVVEELGADAYVYGRANVGDTERTIVARADWRKPPAKGETIFLAPDDPAGVHIFATDSGERLG